jgi:glucokinase
MSIVYTPINNIKNLNLVSILQVFMKYKESISAATVSENTGLSFPTLSRLIRYLKETGILIENDKVKSKMGRKTTLYHLNKDYMYIAGVFFDKRKVNIYISNFVGEILAEKSVSTRHLGTGVEVLENIGDKIEELAVKTFGEGAIGTKIKAIGFCLTGRVFNTGSEIFVKVADVPGWANVDVKDYMTKRFSIETFIENDTNISVMSCHEMDEYKKNENIVFLRIDVGIGSGIIINNELYRGSSGLSGEIRYMVLGQYNSLDSFMHDKPDVHLTPLEELFGVRRIYKDVYNKICSNDGSIICKVIKDAGVCIDSVENIKMEYIEIAAQLGDEYIIKLLYEPIKVWSSIVINLFSCFDPDVLIIGGDVEKKIGYIIKNIRENAVRMLGREVRIEGVDGEIFMSEAVVTYTLENLYKGIVNTYLYQAQ